MNPNRSFNRPITSSTLTSNEADRGKLMTGKERYPIKGGLLNEKQAALLMARCKGMNLIWNCMEKAALVLELKGCGHVAVGSCMVLSRDGLSSYGHYHNPPFEFHAWWQKHHGPGQPVIDIALPGLIYKGLTTSDHVGPYIVGRKPIILAGRPLKWMDYQPIEYFS